MAIKDVINRGVGTPTSLLYFITGGYAIGEPTAASMDTVIITPRDRRIKSSVRDRVINIMARDRREIGKE